MYGKRRTGGKLLIEFYFTVRKHTIKGKKKIGVLEDFLHEFLLYVYQEGNTALDK